MSIIKKSDVKNHLSPGFRTKIHLCNAVSEPDATGHSAAEPGEVQAGSSGFAQDFLTDHSSRGAAIAQAKPVAGSTSPQAPAVSKSARA
jgi:hypothetical protein